MKGARSHLGGDTIPLCCHLQVDGVKVRACKVSFHPEPILVGFHCCCCQKLTGLKHSGESSRYVPFLVFGESLEGLLEM